MKKDDSVTVETLCKMIDAEKRMTEMICELANRNIRHIITTTDILKPKMFQKDEVGK